MITSIKYQFIIKLLYHKIYISNVFISVLNSDVRFRLLTNIVANRHIYKILFVRNGELEGS